MSIPRTDPFRWWNDLNGTYVAIILSIFADVCIVAFWLVDPWSLKIAAFLAQGLFVLTVVLVALGHQRRPRLRLTIYALIVCYTPCVLPYLLAELWR